MCVNQIARHTSQLPAFHILWCLASLVRIRANRARYKSMWSIHTYADIIHMAMFFAFIAMDVHGPTARLLLLDAGKLAFICCPNGRFIFVIPPVTSQPGTYLPSSYFIYQSRFSRTFLRYVRLVASAVRLSYVCLSSVTLVLHS